MRQSPELAHSLFTEDGEKIIRVKSVGCRGGGGKIVRHTREAAPKRVDSVPFSSVKNKTKTRKTKQKKQRLRIKDLIKIVSSFVEHRLLPLTCCHVDRLYEVFEALDDIRDVFNANL